jgi:hypothetical protein
VHEQVFSLIESGLSHGPHCLFVLGETGMGKTRMLGECAVRIESSGGIVALARPLPSDHDAPFTTLRQLLRSGLASAPGAVATDPRALGVLASFDPLLADKASPIGVSSITDVASALTALLHEVVEEQPLALAVDDANLSDGSTIETIAAAMTQLDDAPFFLLFAADPTDECAPTALAHVRGRVGRDFPGATVRLDPLDLDDTRHVVRYMAPWCTSADDQDRLSRRIQFETSGNPFLMTTLLSHLKAAPTIREDLLTWPAHGATLESPLPISVPDLVRVSVVARVARLEEETVTVLRAAAMGGLALDPRLIAALAEVDAQLLERALDELERLGFVRFNGTRYAFTAPLIKETVSAEYLTHGQRQRLRRRAAAELAERDDLESRVLRIELLTRSDPGEETFTEALSIAQEAAEAQADRTARRALAAAERAAGKDNPECTWLVGQLRARLGARE